MCVSCINIINLFSLWTWLRTVMFNIVKHQLLWKCLNFWNLRLVDVRGKEEAIKYQTKETGTLQSTQLEVKRSKQADLCCISCNNVGWNESWRRRKKTASLIKHLGRARQESLRIGQYVTLLQHGHRSQEVTNHILICG